MRGPDFIDRVDLASLALGVMTPVPNQTSAEPHKSRIEPPGAARALGWGSAIFSPAVVDYNEFGKRKYE